MKANVKIVATNAVRGETLIDVAIKVNVPICPDAKCMVKGLVDAILVSDGVMSNFGLRHFTREHIAECKTINDKSCYEVSLTAEGNQMLTCRRPMIRPDEKKPDDSTRLNMALRA